MQSTKRSSFPLNEIQWTTNEPHWREFEWLWQWQVFSEEQKRAYSRISLTDKRLKCIMNIATSTYWWTIIHWCELTRKGTFIYTTFTRIHADKPQTNTLTHEHTRPFSFHQFCDAMKSPKASCNNNNAHVYIYVCSLSVWVNWMQLINTRWLYPAAFSQLLVVDT